MASALAAPVGWAAAPAKREPVRFLRTRSSTEQRVETTDVLRPSCFDVHTDHSDRSAPWHRPATFRKDRTLVLGSEPDEDVCVVTFP